MATYRCKNFGGCSFADSAKNFELAPGGDDRCPECGIVLVPLEAPVKVSKSRLPVMVGAVVVVAALGGIVTLVVKRISGPPIPNVIYPDAPASASSASSSASSVPPPAPAASVGNRASELPQFASTPPHPPASSPPPEWTVSERSARELCDEATRLKRQDADRTCRRAAAITLLNTGAQAAVGGRLDDAEKDYNAARDKDPDIPELYINIAALKARRGRPTEAMDNLTLAGAKGFKRWDLIAKDPAFDVLRADPALSSKLNMLRSAGP